jgi:uncharacterized protein (TIGR02452 family)
MDDLYEQSKSRGRKRGQGPRDRKKRTTPNPLVEIYDETQNYFRFLSRKHYPASECYNIYKTHLVDFPASPGIAEVQVRNEDTLDMARRFAPVAKNGLMVLNMASKFKPGGGVKSGATAQEEVIFRRSNAFMTHPESWYPLDDEDAIFSPDVWIVRDSDYKFYPENEFFHVSMLAVPAIRHPRCRNDRYSHNSDRKLMQRKIESIFEIAILKDKKTLVLGALGCGAYKNPPQEVLDMFRTALQKYIRHFDLIGFAVLANNAAGHENLKLFETLQSVVSKE